MKKTIKLAPHHRYDKNNFGFADPSNSTSLVCCRKVLETAFPRVTGKQKINLTIASKPFKGGTAVDVMGGVRFGSVDHFFGEEDYPQHIYRALQREILPLLDPTKENEKQTIYFRACVRKEKEKTNS